MRQNKTKKKKLNFTTSLDTENTHLMQLKQIIKPRKSKTPKNESTSEIRKEIRTLISGVKRENEIRRLHREHHNQNRETLIDSVPGERGILDGGGEDDRGARGSERLRERVKESGVKEKP